MKKEDCPITGKPFDCEVCYVPDLKGDGKCSYMRGDEYIQDSLEEARMIAEKERDENS